MPTFKLSAPQAGLGIYLLIGAASSNNSIGGSNNAGGALSYMAVYSTPVPSAETIRTMTKAGLPTPLITFPLANKATNGSGAHPATLAVIPLAVATASGTATWFAMYSAATIEESLVIGDITDVATGTGAILLNDLAIVSGKSYQMQNISIALPLTYTF